MADRDDSGSYLKIFPKRYPCTFIKCIIFIPTTNETRGRGIGVIRRAVSLLVKCCASNSSNIFQVILMELATPDPYDVYMCMT